jgi:hypothetical protein
VVNGAVSTTLSADFPGPARKLVEEKVGGIGIFLQGLRRKSKSKDRNWIRERLQRIGIPSWYSTWGRSCAIALGLNTHRFQGDRTTLNNVPNILFKPWQ